MTHKVALITGAASGLGLTCAMKLGAEGFQLFLVDINAESLDKARADLTEQGFTVVTHTANLAEPSACTDAVATCVSRMGRLDALINVAGVMLPSRTQDMPTEHLQLTLAVNLAAPFYLIQAALPYLLEAEGAIVNVASAVGISAQAYNAAYCATKAGLIQMTKSLAMEYISQPIRINAVAPGGMMTPLARNMMNVTDPDPKLMARTSPMRGLVEMEEVADMVALLASDRAKGYHGACIVIDKGMCAG